MTKLPCYKLFIAVLMQRRCTLQTHLWNYQLKIRLWKRLTFESLKHEIYLNILFQPHSTYCLVPTLPGGVIEQHQRQKQQQELLLLTAIQLSLGDSRPYIGTNKTKIYIYIHKPKNTKNTVHTVKNAVNTSTHIIKTHTHYKTHTYTHPHITKSTHKHTHTLQNPHIHTLTLQNPHIHTPTHYKTHTYTHPHITKPTLTHTCTHYKTHTYTHPHITWQTLFGFTLATCIWDWYASDNNLRGTSRGSRKKPNAGR